MMKLIYGVLRNLPILLIASTAFYGSMNWADDLPVKKYQTDTEEVSKNNYVWLDSTGKQVATYEMGAACVKDINTGLIWELKTQDGSEHDVDRRYRWGGEGAEKIGTIFYDDWNSLILSANNKTLCGQNHWRVPSINELQTLMNKSSGLNNISATRISIDTHWFALTLAEPYWSISTYKHYPEHAQTVDFGTGDSNYYNGFRGDKLPLRLVCAVRSP